MTDIGTTMVVGAAGVCLGLLVIGMALAFIRVVRGPSLPDRVVGLDMMAMLMVAFAGAFAIAVDEAAFLDVAIALALVGFLATVAFARYAERRTGGGGRRTEHRELT